MPISLNSGLINPKDFTEWQMVMGKIVPNRELVPGHWLLNWTTSKQRKSGVGGALYLDLMSPSLSILEFGEWLLFKIYYQGERNPKSAGTQNLSYKKGKKKKYNPTKILSVQFLNDQMEIKKTSPLPNWPIFSSNTKWNSLFERIWISCRGSRGPQGLRVDTGLTNNILQRPPTCTTLTKVWQMPI